LAAACLALAGCSLFGKKDAAATGDNRAWPPVSRNAPLAAPGARADADPSAPPPGADNLLAGQILDRTFNKRHGNVSIQVVDMQETDKTAAKLDVKTNEDGYFFIPGLQRGHTYQLIARVKDGERVLSGVGLAAPPNPRLSIYISEDLTNDSTPPPLGPPRTPSKGDKPAASLDPPTKGKPDLSVGAAQDPPAPPPRPPVNPSKIADKGEDGGGFEKYPTAPKVVIPGPPLLPPPPPVTAPGSDGSSSQAPPRRTAPPYCVLLGNKLDDLALADWNGKPWQFRRDQPRKLVLIDFWKTNCPPCLAEIPKLVKLQDKYGGDGLEVVGVAYEDFGPADAQQTNVKAVRLRYNINYTLLRGADSPTGACPVRNQFGVDNFPRLILIDEAGEVVWRSGADGIDDSQRGYLERLIDVKLHPPAK
jgi:thiol-disulfide isomerase/thioredoxin